MLCPIQLNRIYLNSITQPHVISSELWVSLLHLVITFYWSGKKTEKSKTNQYPKGQSKQKVFHEKDSFNSLEEKITGRLESECFQLFQGFLQLHCFLILKFFVLKLRISLSYILHKTSLLLWRSLVLTNLYYLIEHVLLLYQCLLIILVSTNSNNEFMPATFSEWWVWRVLKEESWKKPHL